MLNSIIDNKYRIDSLLGSGGMGAVYRATRLHIGDEVAIKILHAEQYDPMAVERFRREAQAAARLKHPNVVAIHDFDFTENGVQYLVMEFAEGKTLRQIIERQGPLTPSLSAAIITQVCAALDEAHSHNVIHRDIKPDNIIVKFSSTGLQVKVLDFGIAKLRESTAVNLTQTGGILGTPHYMSPEQCLGTELDSRSDVYSLGIALFEMLTGTVPFHSPTATAIVVQHVSQPPPTLRSINSNISLNLERVVLSALAKRPADRQQTAGEFAEQLNKAISTAASGSHDEPRLWNVGRESGDVPFVVPQSSNQSFDETQYNSSSSGNKLRSNTLFVGGGVLLLAVALALWVFTRAPTAGTSQRLNASSPTATQRADSSISEAEVEQFVENWRRAWETKNLITYANCYDENFVGRNFSSRTGYNSMTRSQWLNDKEKKFRVAKSVSVQVGPRTIRNEGVEVSVSFTQAFQSDKYSDSGRKTLYLRRALNGEIKIVREDFVPDRGRG